MIDWAAIERDYPTFRHWESERRQWEVIWRYDPERVALARAVAQLGRAKKAMLRPLFRWLTNRLG